MMNARRATRPTLGFTIIELMTVVLVAGVLLALAVPSMREFAARQRVKAVNAELVTDLQFARSESVASNRTVSVDFRTDDPSMTCYTIHTTGTAVGVCDCRRPLGTACDAVPGLNEFKTVQLLRSTTVTLQPPSDENHFVNFEPRGLSNPTNFRVTIASSVSGELRTATSVFGRPQVCSPNGSIGGVPTCTD